MNRKLSLGHSLLMASILFAASANAAQYSATATVKSLVAVDIVINSSDSGNFFKLNGVTSLGTCPTNGGDVVFRLRDGARGDAMRSLLTAAMLAGKEVVVTVDDAGLLNAQGDCYARSVGLVP